MCLRIGNLPVFRRSMLVGVVLVLIVNVVDAGKVRHHTTGKQGFKHFKNYGIGSHVRRNASTFSSSSSSSSSATITSNSGLWPSVFNLATKAVITANATCGESHREEFCRMVDGGKGRCGICDNFSSDPGKRHLITYAIDGTNKWWQSPALFYGAQYEYVTITIDLKQVYQVAYVIVKAANSPRPGTWILERSLDNEHYAPWQYFARSDKECSERFGVRTTKGKPHYFTDTEVICTSFYSRLTPMENGEIHTSLIHGRPGANETSPELLEFTKARYVRLKLMGLRGTVEPLPKWFSQDISKQKRLYYTIRDISIGGQCVCHGHAQSCRYNVASGHPECECSHHTCGPNCEKCCPMYNQRKWGSGTTRDARQCLPCNCHGHASSCHYDEDIDKAGLSMDIRGDYQGGGVCDNCTKFTTGINCEKCKTGYYRPFGTLPDALEPCKKCDCDAVGSLGTCVQDGDMAGTCHCLPGYAGLKCNRCAEGYRGYPKCEACPCDQRGVVEMNDCEGDCICKGNVDGDHCNRCKLGYFGLNNANPDGCLPCYCSQVTTICESATIIPQKIQTLKGWLITDLNVSEVVKPAWDDKGIFSIGSYELPDIESLYWLAPQSYLGNKLEFYSSMFTFKVQWVIMRGDTSGKPTTGPNIILIGTNGLRIGYGNDFYTGSNMTFSIKLKEDGFYHIPSKVHDIITRLKRTDYRGDPVTRQQFLSILTNIKYILLRSTFHTDQIEALLEEAILDNNNNNESIVQYNNIEKCSCPSGYSGLSCESCSYGYVRIVANLSDHPGHVQSFCGKCDCNGHSATCNPDTGECYCQHNTIGETCERCAPGYYGNPLRGTFDDCKKCACPLENDENNFSPSCQIDYFTETGGYVCTQCPKGFTGDHCEICDYGYYGNPLEIGNNCQLCDCNGGPCDRLTGQCLSCKGNTEGWKCDKCKPGHYGDPLTANCRSCQCDPIGAISIDCDNETGQCLCKERFTGRTCDQCEIGYGNVTALCASCSCNLIGSKSVICDPHSGLCDCQPGVEGFYCDACQNFHYGFSETGCKACNCDPIGSQFPTCELTTGQCICKPNYTGSKCDRCEEGYWKDNSICRPCNCNINGSLSIGCDQNTGQCYCKIGVGGTDCSSCLPNYYGNIYNSCKECEPCNREGHICDPENGRCVCPPLTIGKKCEKCVKNAWGYEPGIGCKACDCSSTGSSKAQCDRLTGRCLCRSGYEGEKCDRCSFGHYGYKHCRKCNCNRAGTLPEDCTHDTCRCNEDGCRCKPNVIGKYCDRCKDGSFGVDIDNPLGCTDCFCFGRSKQCTSAGYTWDQIRTDTVEHVVCANQATCWRLPAKFLGDLTISYGGYLRISSNSAFASNYRVYLTGNGVVLESLINEADIRIHENYWRVLRDSLPTKLPNNCFYSLSRPCLMVILQNVTNIEIEPGPTFKITEFNEILLDKATDIFGVPHSVSVETCECPIEYTSLSCQDPNTGYYRYLPKDGETDNYIDKIVGISRRCQCNDRSNHCDPLTGYCWNCTKHTTGPHCEYCAEGYYKNNLGDCLPCPCPSETQNFAQSCVPNTKFNHFKCICRAGYSGPKCDKCDDSYYGNPTAFDGLCQPCNCNPYGSESSTCDKSTGLCRCKAGFTGKQCSDCISPRQVIQNGVCTPCDECTQILFNTIDELWIGLDGTLEMFENGIGPPWGVFNQTLTRYGLLSTKYDDNVIRAYRIIDNANLTKFEKRLNNIGKHLNRTNKELIRQSKSINDIAIQSKNLINEINELNETIRNTLKNLNEFGKSHIDVGQALREAQQILNDIELLTNQQPTVDNYQDLFGQCGELLNRIEMIYNSDLDPNGLRNDLNELKKRLSAMNMLLDQTESMNKLIKNKNKQHRNRIDNLKRTIDQIDDKNSIINQQFIDLIHKINTTSDILIEIERIYQILSDMEFDKSIGRIEKDTEDITEIFNLLTTVGEHVADLQNKIKTYKSLFNFTKDEWKKIDASSAYDNLIKGINDAEQKANDAKQILDDGLKLLYPDDDDSLADKTNLAMAYSDRLKQRILNLKNPTNDFKRILDDLEKLKYDIFNNGRKNNDLTTILRNMNEQMHKQSENIDDLEKVKDDARNISDNMAQLEKKVKDLNITAQYELIKTYQKYLNLTSGNEIRQLMDQVTLTRLNLQNIHLNFTHFDIVKQANDEQFRNTEKNLKSVENQIQSLKNRIQFAKEVAHSIDVGLSISNCRRRYDIDVDVFTTLTIKYKCKTCSLVNLTNTRGQFVVVNVKNNKITLNWNGILRTMVAPPKTTTINIERIGSIITMTINNDETKGTEPIFAKDLLKLDNNDRIEIGGLSDTKDKSDACIQQVILNDQVIGFWNFAESDGICPGCQTETASIVGENVLFNGNGYSNVTGARRMNPASVDLQFDITTFDENSLLFLAQDKADPCSYLAIILNNGHIELLVRHIDGTNITLQSRKLYNNAIKTSIVMELVYDHNENEQSYLLLVTQSGRNDEINRKQPLKISSVFKIRKSEVFFGGIPSIFNKSCLPFNTTSYLGYLNPGNHEYSDLDRTISFNTKRQDGQLQFTKAWFPGEGFLEIQPESEYDLPVNLSFLLRPIVATGFVMSLNNLIDLYIKSDKLVVKVDDEKYIIDVNLNKDINFVELSFDDDSDLIASVNGVQKSIDFDDILPKQLHLYLGNDPKRQYPSFSGGISNIVINKKTVQFNAETVKKFKQVEIGRSRSIRSPLIMVKSSSIGSIETNNIRDIQNTQGCPIIANYETDPDAVKFGDKPESFIFIENSFWRKDYVLEFQFRTFYPNGLLLLSTGGNYQKHYNLLEIQEGKLRLLMKGKRSKTVIFPNKVNDGVWHYVQIKQYGMKKKRRLTFSLDGLAKKPLRMPRNNVKNELYIGGIPNGFIQNNELENQLHPFRGCMRSLKINNILQTLVRNQKPIVYSNIGQCFPSVEEGAYFGGDAYAIYQADFKVNKVLELSLEFRTAEQNGIILSVSNPGNSPALSVELQNGAVVMTIDKGNGVISHVRNNLKSDFTLCDNRWHNITAMYSSFELTVKVDGIRRSWAQHDELMDEIEAPLYIGGIPDNAPTGTLKIKENFKGCIHKLKIENRLMDWTDMKELNNVLLNSCPVIGT